MSDSETNSPGLSALGNAFLRIGDSGVAFAEEPEWNILIRESDRLLRIVGRYSSDAILDSAALSLAKIICASNRFGEKAATRASSVIQSEKARAGKKRRTDRRWKIIRCAIVHVCRKQDLTMTASDSFAESIRADVIEAAKTFGLTNLRSGTSSRSIERHIAALIKDSRLLNAILEECELQELS